jgi:hypothetical protein
MAGLLKMAVTCHLLLVFVTSTALACTSDLDCSLNGVCSTVGVCECDKPWSGSVCGELKYKTTPASGFSL